MYFFDGQNNDQSVKFNLKTYYSLWKNETCQGDDCATACLVDYNHFKGFCKMILIDLRKRKTLDAHWKAI